MDFGKRASPDGVGMRSTGPADEKGHGSSDLKRKRSGLVDDDAWRALQVPRGPGEVDFSAGKRSENFAAFVGSNLWPLPVDDGQKMLSFSSCEAPTVVGGGSGGNMAFSAFQTEHLGRTGAGAMVREGVRGPFTPSQWMELELQALIYKHIVANVPVPPNLLLPLKRSLYSYGSPGSFASNFWGWGPFHLGCSSSNDPEPGRCRRTDGKKWRCSREAVPDQKYCERHINRGRHRSRKPVEGRTGHAVSGSTNPKVAPIAASTSASVMSSSSAPKSLGTTRNQYNTLQPGAVSTSADLCGRSQGFQSLSLIPPTTDLTSKDAPFSIQKPNVTFEGSCSLEFGNNQNQSLHFIDDWQKDQSTHTSGSWLEVLKSDWTQLSMSIPMAQDLSSPSNSSAQDNTAVSILKPSPELYPLHMSLGTSHSHGESIQKQPSGLQVMWGNSMGGPLGEALTSTATIGESYLSMHAWKNGLQMGLSPTGVLQKSTLVSLSNSSYGSSPLSIENKKVSANATPCNELLGSVLSSSASIPSQ